MGKINGFLQFIDKDFRSALEGMLLYSGFFNVVLEESEGEIIFADELKEDLSFGTRDLVVLFSDSQSENKSENKQDIKSDNNEVVNPLLLEVSKYMRFSELLTMIDERMDSGLPELYGPYGLSGRQGRIANKAKRIGVFSVKGGAGATTVGIAFSKLLYRNGFKPLYMDLSPVAFGNYNANDSISLIYDIKRKRKKNFETYIYEDDGVSYLKREILNKYIDGMDLGATSLIEEYASELGFDAFIYDIGNHIYPKNIEILQSLDAAVLIVPASLDWNKTSMEDMFEEIRKISEVGPSNTYIAVNDADGSSMELLDTALMDGTIDRIIPILVNEKYLETEFGNELRILLDTMLEGTGI